MRRLLRLAARLYPAAWRDRYGLEFLALLDETEPGWQTIVDVLIGGLQMRVSRAQPVATVVALSMAGAFVAAAIAFNTADRFASRATINVRPAVPSTASETASPDGIMPGLAREAFSPVFLTGIIRKHDLYPGERQSSTEDLVNRLRGDIGIELTSGSAIRVSFATADPRKAQTVATDLVSQLVWANLNSGGGSIVQVVEPPGEPRVSVNPRRVAMAGLGGLSGGALIGTLIAWLRRRPSRPAS